MTPSTPVNGRTPDPGTGAVTSGVPQPWWQWLWPLWLGLALLAGVGLHLARQRHQDEAVRMRARLLLQAEGTARHLNSRLVRDFAFTPSEAAVPAQQILRDELLALRLEWPRRAFYVLAQREGACVFGPGTFAPEDPLARAPGTRFRNPPGPLMGVFQSGKGTVVGPYSDERGAFVSAFAPVLDAQTGDVLWVLGIDEPAGDWRARLAQARWVPEPGFLVLSLVFLGLAAWVGWEAHRKAPEGLNLKGSVLAPMVLTLVVVTLGYAWREVLLAQAEQVRNMETLVSRGEVHWDQVLTAEARLLEVQLDRIAENPDLARAMQAGNPVRLREAARPILADLQTRFDTNQFFVADPQRGCLFRGPDSGRPGGLLEHFPLREAQRTGMDAWGLEMGSDGAVTLRFVRPWRRGGEVIGYLELGKDVHRAIWRLAKDLRVDFISLLRKDAVQRETFERGKGAHRYAGTWDAFPQVVVLQQSLPELPGAVSTRLASGPGSLKNMDAFPLHWGDRQVIGGVLQLPEASGHALGSLLLLQDVSADMAAARSRLWMHLRLAGLILLATVVTFWMVTGEAEDRFKGMLHQVEKSEVAFHSLFSDHSAVMLIIDPISGQILDANRAAAAFYGHSTARLKELNIAHLNALPPAEVEARRMDALHRRVNTFEFQHRLADGVLRTVEVHSSPIVWQDRTVLFSIISDITDKKRSEDQRREALNRLEKIASRIPGVVFQFRLRGDGQAELPYASEGIRELFRISPEAVRGDVRPLFSAIHPDDLEGAVATLRISAVTLQPWRHDFRVRFPEGAVRWLHGDAVPEAEADGSVLWHGHISDITESKDAEERVRASEMNFRTFFQAVDDIIVVAAEDGRIRFTNEACARKLGFSQDELMDMSLHDLRPVEHREEAQRIFQAITRGEASSCTLPMQRRGGCLLPVETRVWNGTWDGISCLFSISKDLSVQQAALDKFQKMFHGSPALMSVATLPDRRITDVNDAFLSKLGYTRQEVLGRTGEELGLFEDLEVLDRMVEALQRFGRVADLPLRVRTRRGEIIDGLFAGEVMEHLGQRSLLTVMIDLTAQKQAEAELRQLAESQAATNLELAAARDRALAAVEARSRFLANISHEVRTPLNGLLGMAEVLGATELSTEQLEYVSWISRCGSSLLTFLNDILDFSKMEAGQLTLETISFDLRNMVYETAELFRPRMGGHPVDLRVEYDAAMPAMVLGDAGRFRQLLNNLVSNAVKFTAQGHILIGVRAVPLTGARVRMVLSVQDTGIGIAPEKQAILFQPFVQADATTARRFGGTGLGLAIVKGLVEAMGGRISLESQAGAGSTFTVEVDVRVDPQALWPPEAEAGLDGMRLLLVVDLPSNLAALRRQLQAQDVHLEAVTSGPAALDAIEAALKREEPFDLVVVDLLKPEGMTGDVLGQAVRANARCQGMALAALTSVGVKGDPARLAALGFDAYLLKPLPGEQLCRSLALAIQQARQHPQAELITRYTLMPHPPTAAQPSAPLLQSHLLVVEDQEPNQIVLRKLLERVGARVTVAADGHQALAAIAGTSFDLVLMDCQMPGMDGFEATARIRALEQGTDRHLPIVAMTAHATAGDRERCLAVGMDDYLTKPIHMESVLKAIARWTRGGAEALPPLAAPAAPGTPWEAADAQLELDQDLFGKLLDLYDQDAQAMSRELLKPFLTTGRDRLELLNTCLAKGEYEAMASVAHAIKGSARTLGFRALGALMERLEQEAKAGHRHALEAQMQDAQQGFALAQTFYQSLTG